MVVSESQKPRNGTSTSFGAATNPIWHARLPIASSCQSLGVFEHRFPMITRFRSDNGTSVNYSKNHDDHDDDDDDDGSILETNTTTTRRITVSTTATTTTTMMMTATQVQE
jgi:hypothetical protein